MVRFDGKCWVIKIESPTRMEIIKYAVNNHEWQKFRLSLKGKSTFDKLTALDRWIEQSEDKYIAYIQVNNYLGALKRGGQVSAKGEVLK